MAPAKLREEFWAHRGLLSDKWQQYLPVYEAELEHLIERGEPISLLEIGVQNGGSLELWHKVLPPNSRVVGIDINEQCRELGLNGGIQLHIGDATQLDFIDRALGDTCFDVIIDDGSHHARDVITSFDLVFARLKPGGIYIVEDMHTSYWASFGGGFRIKGTPIEWAKDIIDALNVDHFEDTGELTREELTRLQAFNTQIARLAFFDSMIVVQKHVDAKNRPFSRLLTGDESPILDPMNWVPRLPAEKFSNLLVGAPLAQHLDSGLRTLLDMKDAEIEACRLESSDRARETERQAQELKRQAQQIKSQQRELSRLDRRNKSLLNSASWKITAPIRSAAGVFASMRTGLRRLLGQS